MNDPLKNSAQPDEIDLKKEFLYFSFFLALFFSSYMYSAALRFWILTLYN